MPQEATIHINEQQCCFSWIFFLSRDRNEPLHYNKVVRQTGKTIKKCSSLTVVGPERNEDIKMRAVSCWQGKALSELLFKASALN